MGVFYGTAFLFVLVLLEMLAIRFILKEAIPWKEIILNLNSGHVLLWIFRGMEVIAFHYSFQYLSLGWVGQWPYYFQIAFAFVAWDFCFYWLHRMHHEWPFLWSIHEVHHQGEHFSLSLGIRNSWYSSLTSFPFFIILAVVGVPLEIFIGVSSIHYFIQFYNHNRIVKKSGFLEHVMITPAHHRVHHGKNPEYIDKNHGGTFVFWDKLFGTFQAERADVPIEFGIKEVIKSENPFWINNIPFLKLFGFKSPQLKEGNSYKLSDFNIGIGGLILFCILLLYIYFESVWPLPQKLSVFTLLFLGTIANGGLAENKTWGWISWIIISLLGGLSFLLLFWPNDYVVWLLFAALMIHGGQTLGVFLSNIFFSKK